MRLHKSYQLSGHHFRRAIRCGDTTQAFAEGNSTVSKLLQPLVCSPDVRKKLAWDSVGFLLVAHDIFMIPFMQAFDFEMTTPFLIISIVLAIYWTLDIITTFFTGYIEKGITEMRLKMIGRRYFQSWFMFDFLIILIDWLFIISILILQEGGVGVPVKLLRVLRSARAVRTLRMLALVRVAKARHIISYISQLSRHPAPQALIKVLEATLMVLMINHFVACSWYWIAALSKDNQDQITWVKQKNIQDTSVGYRYGTSLHWAITQFTPASMDVQPTNTEERYFTLLVDMFGLVVFSTFVSTITTNMTQVRLAKQQKKMVTHQLKLYFRENKVSLELARRIMSFIQPDKDHFGARIHMSHLAPINTLPPPLLHDLKLEVFSPAILNHPFFYVADSIDREMSNRICDTAVSEHSWARDDRVFEQGEEGTGMFFVAAGTLSYLRADGIQMLEKGTWIAEPALWIEGWEYRGSLRADTLCECMKVDVVAFREAIKDLACAEQSQELEHFVQMYASTFVRFNPSEDSDAPLLLYTDLWVSPDELSFTVESELLPRLRVP